MDIQWWFVDPDTFVPGRYFWINEFSWLLNHPSVQERKSVPALFVRISERIYNDKADSYPQHVGKFLNFRIFSKFFIHEVKKTLKFWLSGPYLYRKYQ